MATIGRPFLVRAAGVCVMAWFLAAPCAAWTINVNVTEDANDGVCSVNHCTLREAIIVANTTAGDDTIVVPPGTYTLTITGTHENAAATGDLDVIDAATLSIHGSGPASTIIDGNDIDRVFHVFPGAELYMQHLTITGGGYFTQGGTGGGGIWNQGGSITTWDCRITDNRTGSVVGADYYGGGILVTDGGDYQVKQTQIDANLATHGGGAAILDGDDSGWTIFTDVNVHGNTATVSGGGLYLAYDTPVLAITDVTLSGNSAGIDGGAIANHTTTNVVTSTLSGNTSNGSTGGILNAGTLDVWYSTIADNSGFDLFNISDIGASTSMRNSIIVGECGGQASFLSDGGNLESPGNTCNLSIFDIADLTWEQINLGPLGDHGGGSYFYGWTRLPRSGSVAIDFDLTDPLCVGSDQRNVERPQDGDFAPPAHCDAGSVEVLPLEHLVLNGNFPFDLGGWNVELPATSSLVWDARDAAGRPNSGSARGNNANPTSLDSVFFSQCTEEMSSGLEYEVGASLLLPGSQPATGEAHIEILWYSEPGCLGTLLDQMLLPAVTTATPDQWVRTRMSDAVAPTDQLTVSALLRLVVTKDTVTSYSLNALFDEVFFHWPDPISADGFESGDFSGWDVNHG